MNADLAAPDLSRLGVTSIWQPAGADPKSGHLLIFLHGRGDSAEGWADFQQMLSIPGLSVLLLNAPDAYFTGYSWYGMPPDQLPGILRSRALLDQVLPELNRQGYPPERCVLGGFSQGCLMTLEFGARYPERLAGYLGISGYCFDPQALLSEASAAARSGRWLVTHGTLDDVLPVETTRAQIQELKQGGIPIDYREYRKEHTLDMEREAHDLHAWLLETMK